MRPQEQNSSAKKVEPAQDPVQAKPDALDLSGESLRTAPVKSRADALLGTVSANEDMDLYRKLHWRGGFSDYLDRIIENPKIAASAIQRVHNMILADGSEIRETASGKARHYKFFDDPKNGGRDAVFGLDAQIDSFVRVLEAGANQLGMEKRIILLQGPVGSAKSTIVRLLKQGLEQYSRTDDGAVYVLGWKKSLSEPEGWSASNPGKSWDATADDNVEWSPMNEDPLTFVPKEKRKQFLATLNESIREKHEGARPVGIHGGLSPLSRARFNELMDEHGGNLQKVWEHVVVKRVLFSEEDRVGLGTFQPKDPKSQDSTELTGDINFRKIAESGKDSDPRAFNFDGEFCISNRGMIEFQEAIKLDLTFLYELLGASQEKVVKPKKFQQIEIDELIIAHTNRPEFEKLKQNPYMEALRDRIVKVDIPYVTSLEDEMKVYEKDFNKERIHGHFVAPHTVEVASMLAVLSRISEPKEKDLSLVDKMYLYAGRNSSSGSHTDKDVKELKKAAPNDGLDGLSPRFIQETLNECLVQAGPGRCVSPYLVFRVVEEKLRESTRLNPDQIEGAQKLLALVKTEHEKIIKSEVQMAIAYDKDVLDKLAMNYIAHVNAFIQKQKVTDPVTGQNVEPDVKFLKSIEEKMGIKNDSHAQDFRISIMHSIASAHLMKKDYDYSSNKKLFDALSQKLFDDNKDQISLRQYASQNMDPKMREKIDTLKDTLVKNFGYNDESAEQIIMHAASIFAR